MDKETVLETSFEQDDTLYNKQINPQPAPAPEIGIDIDNELLYNILESST